MILGFIGSGKMATALARGVAASGAFPRGQLLVTDVVPAAAAKLAALTGAIAVESNRELAGAASALLLCVKPADALGALADLRGELAGKLVISIVAGLSTKALQNAAGAAARIVRVMPNTPALVQTGAAAYAVGETATEEDAALVETIFRAVGLVCRVNEELLDAVTGLSGSGPAFVYLLIEALADGGVLMGLPRDLSLQLAAQTVAGAARMVLESGAHPAALRDQVTSPGGTTIAGLEALEAHGARAALLAAVRAATERSRELGTQK
jgi:pyrroline-5-carboxylate reductase